MLPERSHQGWILDYTVNTAMVFIIELSRESPDLDQKFFFLICQLNFAAAFLGHQLEEMNNQTSAMGENYHFDIIMTIIIIITQSRINFSTKLSSAATSILTQLCLPI